MVSVASGDSKEDQESIWLDDDHNAARPLSPIMSPEDSPFKGVHSNPHTACA